MFEFKSILCGTDLQDHDEDVLCHALKLALAGRCELIVAHADGDYVTGDGRKLPELRERLARWGATSADTPVERLEPELGLRVSLLRLPGRPDGGLAHLVAARSPDLMVLGTEQRRGVGRWVHPSTAEAMSRVARVPTLFVPQGGAGLVSAATGELRLGRILVPVATWPDASFAAQLAQRLASTLGLSNLHYRTLHVGGRADAPTMDRMRDEAFWEHRDRPGAVVDGILEEADSLNADLIVMATQGHDSLGDRLFGSTVEQVVRRSGCPVLAAPTTM